MKNLLFIMLSLLFFCCSDTGWNCDLGNGYAYLNSGGAMDVDVYKGNAITYKSLFDDPVVFPSIDDYKFNSDFIVCKQNYDKKLTSELLQSSFEFRFNNINYKKGNKKYFGIISYIKEYKNDTVFYNDLKKLNNIGNIGFTKSIADSVIKNNNLFLKMEKQIINYYIIDKTKNKRYLVLSKIQFQKIFLNLKIPDSLKV